MKNHICIIDDGVKLSNCENYIICSDKIILDPETYSFLEDHNHATVIANIIHMINPHVSISSIKVLDKELNGNIYDLIKAIKYAINEIRPNIIQLSLGSIKLDDGFLLYPVINEAINSGIKIVSAYNNSNTLTYPAHLDNVYGVMSSESTIATISYIGLKKVYQVSHRPQTDILHYTSDKLHNSYSAAVITGLLTRDDIYGEVSLTNKFDSKNNKYTGPICYITYDSEIFEGESEITKELLSLAIKHELNIGLLTQNGDKINVQTPLHMYNNIRINKYDLVRHIDFLDLDIICILSDKIELCTFGNEIVNIEIKKKCIRIITKEIRKFIYFNEAGIINLISEVFAYLLIKAYRGTYEKN